MALGSLWYGLLALTLAVYVVLDGFDLGAGILLPLVARGPQERRVVISSLGPVWDGNEVWLLAAGGTLVLAFPRAYACALSGFYLPMMLVLWLLVFRALSIELHHHLDGELWQPLCETAFAVSSLLLVVLLGAALGNVARGVDADAQGRFFCPLFTDLSGTSPVGILDWYTVLAGLTALAAVGRHGALWLNLKTEGDLQARAAFWARRLGMPTALLASSLSVATAFIQPRVLEALFTRLWLWLPALSAAAGLIFSRWALRRGLERAAFLGSAFFLAALIFCAAGGLYPSLLPSNGAGLSLDVVNSASPDATLGIALAWWLPGLALAALYFVVLYRSLPRKFR